MKGIYLAFEEFRNELNETFNNVLESFLCSIDGYNQLDDDCKVVCKIFVCLHILMKLEGKKKK